MVAFLGVPAQLAGRGEGGHVRTNMAAVVGSSLRDLATSAIFEDLAREGMIRHHRLSAELIAEVTKVRHVSALRAVDQLGPHDCVAVVEAPSDEVATACALGLAAHGNVTTL